MKLAKTDIYNKHQQKKENLNNILPIFSENQLITGWEINCRIESERMTQ
jgi:hypothetical protein